MTFAHNFLEEESRVESFYNSKIWENWSTARRIVWLFNDCREGKKVRVFKIQINKSPTRRSKKQLLLWRATSTSQYQPSLASTKTSSLNPRLHERGRFNSQSSHDPPFRMTRCRREQASGGKTVKFVFTTTTTTARTIKSSRTRASA